MLKKMCKGVYLILFVLFMAGSFCLFPSLKGAKADTSSTTEKVALQPLAASMPDKLWSSGNVSEMAVSRESVYGHDNAYVVSDAAGLAEIAYNVNHGVQDFTDKVVISLNSDIDLNGALWTPIGTEAKPFKGIFYGNGHTISNISIDEVSCEGGSSANSGAGLFGVTEGAVITDVRLTGWQQIYTGGAKGALIGIMNGGYVINCYDECTTKTDQSGNNISSIGTAGTSSYIFDGYAYLSGGNLNTLTETEASKIHIKASTGAITRGKVGFYQSGSGAFKFGNKSWYEPNLLRVLLNNDLTDYTTKVCNLYYNTNPVKRVEALGDVNTVYVLLNGKEPNIARITNDDASNSFVKSITYGDKEISVPLNYGYGTRGTQGNEITVVFNYDQTFADFFKDNEQYKTRLGYAFEGLYRGSESGSKVNVENADDYNLSYPQISGEIPTYCFKWNWIDVIENETENKNIRNFAAKFAYASDEGGKIVPLLNDPFTNVVKSMSSSMSWDGKDKYITNNAFTGDSYTFTVVLKQGFMLADIASQSEPHTVLNQKGQLAIENYAQGTIVLNGTKADVTSGLYTHFKEYTNIGGSYDISGKNNDIYQPVSVYATKSKTEDGLNQYEVTVDHVVSYGGTLYLVVEREFVDVDITPVDVDGNSINATLPAFRLNILPYADDNASGFVHAKIMVQKGGETAEYSVNGDYGFTTGEFNEGAPQVAVGVIDETNRPVFLVRYNDNASFNISVVDALKDNKHSGSKYILNVDSKNFSDNPDVQGLQKYTTEFVAGTNGGFNSNPSLDYYSSWNIKLQGVYMTGSKITTFIGTVRTRVTINFLDYAKYQQNPNASDEELALNVSSNVIKATINAGQALGVNLQGVFIPIISGKDESGQTQAKDDSIVISKNGKYQAAKAVIIETKDGTTKEIEANNGKKYFEGTTDIDSAYYLSEYYKSSVVSAKELFKTAYSHADEINYEIKIYFEERSYDLKVEYYVSDGSVENVVQVTDENKAVLFDSFYQGAVGLKPNSEGREFDVNYALTTIGSGAIYRTAKYELWQDGKKALYNDGADHDDFANEDEYQKGGYNSSEAKVSIGDYDTVLKVYFEYKQVELNINKLFVRDDSSLVDIDTPHLATLTFSFSSEGVLSLSGEIGSIALDSQYYLLGWYLKNGEVVSTEEGSYDGLKANQAFVDAIATAGSSQGNTVVFNDLAALVARRTVSVNYNAGEAGEGKLYENTDSGLTLENKNLVETTSGALNAIKADGALTFNTKINLSNYSFFNLGYAFNTYSVKYGTVADENGVLTFILNGKGWIDLFNEAGNNISATSVQTWNKFASTDGEKFATVDLVAQWNIIKYILSVDDGYGTPKELSIGDKIYFNETTEKTGVANYTISDTSSPVVTQTFSGATKNGYVAKGFSLSQDGKITKLGGGDTNYKLTPELFLQFIAEDYKFAINDNDSPIMLTTERDPARYIISLVNSDGGYYTYAWDETKDGGDWGQIDGNGQITINATYDALPSNILDAVSGGALSVNRLGYRLVGWAYSALDGDNKGVQTGVFKTDEIFKSLSDIAVVPVWEKVDNTTTAQIKFSDDVTASGKPIFYLLNSHDVIRGFLGGNNVDGNNNSASDKNLVLKNGEKVTGFKFIVTSADGTVSFETVDLFNINKLLKNGDYSIKFEITIADTLTRYGLKDDGTIGLGTISYSATSAMLDFTMAKNELYFFDNNFATIYNGTKEFVEGVSNDYGQFIYKFDWDGTDRSQLETKPEPKATEDYFNPSAYEVLDSDGSGKFNAGSGKSLKIKVDTDKLGDMLYENLVSNVVEEGGSYYVTLDGVLTIEKARFTVDFVDGTAYYFDGVETTVYVNKANEISFNVGKVTFKYSYSKLTLKMGSPAGVYTGTLNHDEDAKVFNIYDLAIEGHVDDRDTNFEWNVTNEKRFTLLDSRDALGLDYSTRYLTANGGVLANALSSLYKDKSDNLFISNLLIDNVSKELPEGEQGSVISDDNQVVLSFVGNGTQDLKLFFNKNYLASHTVSVKVNIDMSVERENDLTLLSFVSNSANMTSIAALFDDGLVSGYSLEVAPNGGDANASFYGVLTDVVKVNVNYNGGANGEGAKNETIYTSSSTGEVVLNNPVREADYLSFNGYNKESSKSNITIREDRDNGKCFISNAKAGQTETITAKWKFDRFDFEVTKALEYYASVSSIKLPLSEFTQIQAPSGVTGFTATMVGKDKGASFIFSSVDNSFTIVDKNSQASFSLNDVYTVTITYTFSDGFAPQSVTQSEEVGLTINRNTISLSYNGGDLTFNNADQKGNIILDFIINNNEESKGQTTLLNVPNTDNSNGALRFYASVYGSNGQIATSVRNVDTYTIKASIDSNMKGVYQFADGIYEQDLDVNIIQYVINLSNYADGFEFFKYFGLEDPSPIKATVTIRENSNDTVDISFDRVAGEAIGQYALTAANLMSSEDRQNYAIDAEDFANVFDVKFEIRTPSGKLQVSFDEKIIYTYNGYAATGYAITYNGTNYTLTITAGSESYSTTFDIYYLSGDKQIAIPAEEKEHYTQFITMTSSAEAVFGEYPLSVVLTQEAVDANWSGVEFANADKAQISVEKRTLTINSIDKVYDGTVDFVYNTVNKDKNSCEINLSGLVSVNGVDDEVSISGKISLKNAGKRNLSNVALSNVGRGGSYTLVYADDLQATVIADSTSTVSFNTTLTNLPYGDLKEDTSLEIVINKFAPTFSYAGGKTGEIDKNCFVITDYEIKDAVYSTGKYLKAGTYTIVFTVTSKDFTFKGALGGLDEVYTTTYEKTIVVDKKVIEITNSTLTITKQYDGNNELLGKFVGQNVNAVGGFYSSNGVLSGDIITVTSGTYSDSLIASGKKVTLVYNLSADDSENYTITTNVTGDITSTPLIFNKNGNSGDIYNPVSDKYETTFANDGITSFENADPMSLSYNGNIDSLIGDILASGNRLIRKGYTNTGWKLGVGESAITISRDMSAEDKATLLQAAVDGGSIGIEINAIWERNSYTVTFAIANGQLSIDGSGAGTTLILPYYNEGNEVVTLVVTADEGYKFIGRTLSAANIDAVIASGQNDKNATITLARITDNVTLTVNTSEIVVRIIVDYNKPGSDYVVSTETEGWIGVQSRDLKYSEMLAGDLPELTLNHGYIFDRWTTGGVLGEAGGVVNTGENIWQRINGASLERDNLAGITFYASWKEDEIDVNISYSNASIAVFDIDEDREIAPTNVDGKDVYKVLYTHDIRIEITSNDFYKWTGFEVTPEKSFGFTESKPNNHRTGEAIIDTIKDTTNVKITISPMKFSFATSYVTPDGTEIAEKSGDISGEYDITKGENFTLSDLFANKTYTAAIGTYTQEAWAEGLANNFALNAKLVDVIKAICGGVPEEERYDKNGITLKAVFKGVIYTVTFDKTDREGVDFAGAEAGQQTVTRQYEYGKPMTNIPTLTQSDDEEYVWHKIENQGTQAQIVETFAEGQLLISQHFRSASHTLDLKAAWGLVYDLVIDITGNVDKYNSVKYDGFNESGTKIEVRYFNGATKLFTFSLAKGYELGEVSGLESEKYILTENTLTILGLEDHTNITVSIVAKAYNVTIETNEKGYYTISGTTQFEIRYDENIAAKFNSLIFTRPGYDLKALMWGTRTFATFDGSAFTFASEFINGTGFIVSDDELYEIVNGTRDITLSPVWQVKADYSYISLVTTGATLTYNGAEQAVATSGIYVDGTEVLSIGVQGNGDEITGYYYMLDGVRTNAASDFSLMQKNVLSGKTIFVIEIKDTLTGQTRTLSSSEVNVEIVKSSIAISDAKLSTFYSGTKVYYPTSDDAQLNSLGKVTYAADGADNRELSIDRVELIDDNGLYEAGNSFTVKYYLNNAGGFDISNYSGLSIEGGFVTFVTDDSLKAKVEKAQIILSFREKGYYKDAAHTVRNLEFVTSAGVETFDIKVNKVTTNDKVIKVYDLASEFVYEYSAVDAMGVERKNNFEILLAEDSFFEIISTDQAYRIDLQTKYFNAGDFTLADNSANVVKATGFEQTNVGIKGTLENGDLNFMTSEGELLFSIVGNGQSGAYILIQKGVSLSLSLEIGGTMNVLQWNELSENEAEQIAELTTVLNTLEGAAARTETREVSDDATIVAFVTDYKAIMLRLGDIASEGKGDTGYVYVKLGSSVSLPSPEADDHEGDIKGFEFESWISANDKLTIAGSTLTASADAGIATDSVTANWLLETPDGVSQDITFSAKIDLNGKEEITLDRMLGGEGDITNRNGLISYTYRITKGGVEVATSDTFTLPTNTSSNGEYILTITASRSGYQPKSLELSFNVTVERLVLGAMELSDIKFVYQNKDFLPELYVTFTGAGLGREKVADLLGKADSSYSLTLTEDKTGVNVGEIKLAGTYTVALVADETIFDLSSASLDSEIQIVVAQAEIVVGMDDIPSAFRSKLFGNTDPEFNIDTTMFEGDAQQELTISLSRESGENIGTYRFTVGRPSNDNFYVTITEDAIFTINQSDVEVTIRVDNPLVVTYTKKAPTITLTYDNLAGKWVITLGEASSTITLTYVDGDEVKELDGFLKVLALENLTLTADGAINAASYSEADITISGRGNFSSYLLDVDFTIEKVVLNLDSTSKVFDRNDTINKEDANFTNVVEGDEVYLTGRYAQVTAGQNIDLLGIAIAGADIANYILPEGKYVGSITPAVVESVSFDITNKTFTYGQIGVNTAIEDVLALIEGFTLSIGGVTTDVENGFASISSILLDNGSISGAGLLKAGSDMTISFVITSSNFVGLMSNGYSITVEIKVKDLDLSSVEVVKQYDETNKLPASFDTNIDAYIESGDRVEIDLDNSGFYDAEVGTNKPVLLSIKGEDSANYKVLNNVKGDINNFTIEIVVNASTEHADLVSGGKFVSDGIVAEGFTFKVGYPLQNITAEELLASFRQPTRKGYKFAGYKLAQNGGYITLDSSNIVDVLKEVVTTQSGENLTLNIYASWTIEKYSITLSGNNVEDITVTANPANALTNVDGVYYVEYFTDVEIDFVGERGFKVRSYNLASGETKDKDLTDTGNLRGKAILKGIASAVVLSVTYDEMEITLSINLNLPANTNRTDSNSLSPVYKYSELASITEENLPRLTATEGTYTLERYTYSNGLRLGEKNFQQIVDELFPDLDGDKTVVLDAVWTSAVYKITFDATDGAINGSNVISARYGQALGAFPQAVLAGKNAQWNDKDGKIYNEGDILETIGVYDANENVFTLTFAATWTNAPFDLTLVFDDGLTVNVNGNNILSGQTFTLVYNETNLQVAVTPKQGYTFEVNDENLHGEITNNGYFIIKNLIADSSVVFNILPDDNTLQLFNENIANYQVFIDDEEVTISGTTVVAKTEQRVRIVYTAKKGYEFTESSVVFAGNGKVNAPIISEDKKTLTYVWEEFVSGASLSVRAQAALNKVTVSDVRNIFLRLSFNSTNITLSGDTFLIRTGETFTVSGVMAYGYTAGNLATGQNNYVVEGSVSNVLNADGYYYFSASLAGFDEDFAIEFTATPRTYTFSVNVAEGQGAYGEITSDSVQVVDFGKPITLTQRELVENYEFIGWKIGENVISTEPNTNYVVSSDIRDALEAAGEEGIIPIFAWYARKERNITFVATGKGSFTASQESEEITVDVIGQNNGNFFLGLNVDLVLAAQNGYELSEILLDGVKAGEGDFEIDGNKISIYLDLYDPITHIEVVFTPSEIEVVVQSSTQVNYIDNLGSTKGGKVFATNSDGERYSEDKYHEYQGNLIIGGNYTIISYTDEVLYFEVVAEKGFTASVVTSSGMIQSQTTINGNGIYIITGATKGSQIVVRSIAKEHNIKIMFVNEGEDITKGVHGGIFTVDTSNELVSSRPSRGDSINVAVVTGAGLRVDIASLISYSLLTGDDGLLKYHIIYSGDETFNNIQVSQVTAEDPLSSGFTNSAYFIIDEVTAGATIVVYVEPKEYTLKFVVDENTSVTMEKKIRFGEEWDLSSLSANDYGTVFAKKKGFTFAGYYYYTSDENAIQYIDKYNDIMMNWQNTGYTHKGSMYEQDRSFDATTQTFTLYARYVYDRAKVRVEVSPSKYLEDPNYSNFNFITNLAALGSSAWTGQENRWYSEIAVGSTLEFAAPEIEGYEFVGFTVQLDGGEITERGKSFTIKDLVMGEYVVRALYNPTVKFTIKNNNNDFANGGESFARQDGGILSGSFDAGKLLTLVAVPIEGYKFLYWENNSTGEQYIGKPGVAGEIVYEFTNLIDYPLDLTAVFEGRNVAVNFNAGELGSLHTIVKVLVNGKQCDYNSVFNAAVGDTLVVVVQKSRGYGFGQSIFESVYDSETNTYVFSYVLDVKDLTEVEGGDYTIKLSIPVTREDITLAFNLAMTAPLDNAEILKSGTLYFIDGSGSSIKVNNGDRKTVKYGDNFSMRIIANANYKYEKTYVVVDGITFDASEYVVNGTLSMGKDFMDRFFGYQINIYVYFARVLWTDEDARASGLSGSGTDEDPYLIKTARDFAFVAYAVNNGETNDEGIPYSECSYKVTNSIGFEGRYWEPIGTKENPFKGKIDLGAHEFKNVLHYKSYPEPRLSYSGLFWCVDKDAQITVNTKTMTTIIIVIVVVVVVVILIIILIILLAKRRKKKLDKLANQ